MSWKRHDEMSFITYYKVYYFVFDKVEEIDLKRLPSV